ncbi:hypothetical protein Q8A73_020377 [Channa argus]|nr:hypothetical protein Q8A73_020377 [Channa argus]
MDMFPFVTPENTAVCPLFHPVLFSVCRCWRCNWGLALDKDFRREWVGREMLARGALGRSAMMSFNRLKKRNWR